jgi:hypothetical protein
VFTTQPFVHRSNADGTTDSFCRKCLITVASSPWEAELERAERKHQCDPIQLEYVQGILDRPQASGGQSTAAGPKRNPHSAGPST